jgi:hypothetical protein
MGLSLAAPATARPTPSLTLVRAGDNLYLQRGKERLLLSGTERRSVPRAGGWTLLLTPDGIYGDREISTLRNGKVVAVFSLDALRTEWLKNDALWGPGKAGNDMRYMHQSAGGIGAFLYEAQPTAGGWVGVLSWRMFGPSFDPIRVRHLVFIPASSNGRIQPVRLLPKGEELYQPTPLLHRYSGRLLIHETDRLSELDGRGKAVRLFMRLPASGEPYTLFRNRWLIRVTGDSFTAGAIEAVDLRKKEVVTLLRRRRTEASMESLRIIDADETTGLLLVERVIHGERKELLLIGIPSGRLRPVQPPWAENLHHLWKGMFVTREEEAYCLYDADTLRLVKKPKSPPDLS